MSNRSVITYTNLADLHEALNLPGAAHFRRSAAELEVPDLDAAEDLEAIRETLSAVPEPPKSTKHTDDCWKRHARCLADRLTDGEAA